MMRAAIVMFCTHSFLKKPPGTLRCPLVFMTFWCEVLKLTTSVVWHHYCIYFYTYIFLFKYIFRSSGPVSYGYSELENNNEASDI